MKRKKKKKKERKKKERKKERKKEKKRSRRKKKWLSPQENINNRLSAAQHRFLPILNSQLSNIVQTIFVKINLFLAFF